MFLVVRYSNDLMTLIVKKQSVTGRNVLVNASKSPVVVEEAVKDTEPRVVRLHGTVEIELKTD